MVDVDFVRIGGSVGGTQLYQCSVCGAVVSDQERHRNWHQKFIKS